MLHVDAFGECSADAPGRNRRVVVCFWYFGNRGSGWVSEAASSRVKSA